MKKVITVLGIVSMLAFAVPTFADSKCGDPSLSDENTTFMVCGNGNPEMVMNVWGTTNSQLPHILPGQSYRMSNGFLDTCPAWFTRYCVDISVTDYWKDRWGK